MLEIEWTKEAFFLSAPCLITTLGVLTKVGNKLTTPVGYIYFIGTKTSSVWCGYIEGAVQSS
jgi:monoamine oxidase